MKILNKNWFKKNEFSLPEDKYLEGRVLRKRPLSKEINLSVTRPFKNLSSNDLAIFGSYALKRPWPAIELATLIFDEAAERVEKGGNKKTLNVIKREFEAIGRYPINWLKNARKIIRSKTTRYPNKKGIGSVYFVLIDGFTKQNQYYGCYVGQTRTSKLEDFSDNQTARISQHFQGVNSSKKVQKRGLEALWSLNCFSLQLTNSSDEIKLYETNLHESLETCIPKVLGDKL